MTTEELIKMTTEELIEFHKKRIQLNIKYYIDSLNSLVKEVKENNLENEQWFINFLDELNKISVSW